MNNNNFQVEDLILNAIASMSKSKALTRTSKREAIDELKKAVEIFNEAIKLLPNDIGNRLTRSRHLFEASKVAPVKFYEIINEDLKFFDKNYHLMNDIDKCSFHNIKGEYLIYIGDIESGKSSLENTLKLDNGTILGDYARKILESF